MQLVDLGKSLEKVIISDRPRGQKICDLFELRSPKCALEFDEIQHQIDRLFIFHIKSLDLSLRGQLSLIDNHYYFLGAPWIVDQKSLNHYGLKLNDFAVHDPISDLINVINSQRVALEESNDLAEILQSKQIQLKQARDQAEEAYRAKTLFLANMSHELRTPMNAILGYTQLMQRGGCLNPQHTDFLDRIRKSGSHLLELLDDLLEMSKIESGNETLHPTDTDLKQTIRGIWDMCLPQAEKKQLDFRLHFEPEVPQIVCIDYRKLRQILLNVIGNAIKFTGEKGTVEMIISSPGPNKIKFSISDTGIGINEDSLDAIFQPFERCGKGRHSFNGTGLGLAITKRFIDLMKGRIEVKSCEGVGTTFLIELPAEMMPETNCNLHHDSQKKLNSQTQQTLELVDSPNQAATVHHEPQPEESWIEQMKIAAESMDFKNVEQLLNQIAGTHPMLHKELYQLSSNFYYEEIPKLLETKSLASE